MDAREAGQKRQRGKEERKQREGGRAEHALFKQKTQMAGSCIPPGKRESVCVWGGLRRGQCHVLILNLHYVTWEMRISQFHQKRWNEINHN